MIEKIKKELSKRIYEKNRHFDQIRYDRRDLVDDIIKEKKSKFVIDWLYLKATEIDRMTSKMKQKIPSFFKENIFMYSNHMSNHLQESIELHILDIQTPKIFCQEFQSLLNERNNKKQERQVQKIKNMLFVKKVKKVKKKPVTILKNLSQSIDNTLSNIIASINQVSLKNSNQQTMLMKNQKMQSSLKSIKSSQRTTKQRGLSAVKETVNFLEKKHYSTSKIQVQQRKKSIDTNEWDSQSGFNQQYFSIGQKNFENQRRKNQYGIQPRLMSKSPSKNFTVFKQRNSTLKPKFSTRNFQQKLEIVKEKKLKVKKKEFSKNKFFKWKKSFYRKFQNPFYKMKTINFSVKKTDEKKKKKPQKKTEKVKLEKLKAVLKPKRVSKTRQYLSKRKGENSMELSQGLYSWKIVKKQIIIFFINQSAKMRKQKSLHNYSNIWH